MSKKTYYISVPMQGRERKDIEDDLDRVWEKIPDREDDALVVTPNDVVRLVGHEDDMTYGGYLGIDIAFIIDHVDAVIFTDGWHESKGCKLEFQCAKIYGKEIIYEHDMK